MLGAYGWLQRAFVGFGLSPRLPKNELRFWGVLIYNYMQALVIQASTLTSYIFLSPRATDGSPLMILTHSTNLLVKPGTTCPKP